MNSRILLFAILLVAPRPAIAQEAHPSIPVSGESLTLDQAYETALESNPAYRIVEMELMNVGALERPLWLAYVPSVSVSLSTRFSQSRTFTAIDDFGRPVRVDDPIIATSSGSSQSLGWGQITLFDGGAKIAEARRDRATAGTLRSSAALAAIELRTRVANRYYDVAAAEAEVALAERMLASARDLFAGTERLFRIGLKDPLDLLGAEIQAAEREHALERARGAVRSARLALGNELGVGQEIAATLVDDLPEAFDPTGLDGDSLVAAGVGASPVLARLESSADAAAHGVSIARSQRWPLMSMSVNSGRGVSARGRDALFDLNPLDQSYGASLSFSLPIFDGFQATDAISRARVSHQTAQENLRAGQLQLESRIRGALIDLQNAWRDIGLAERSAELSRQRLELATEKYELGGAAFEEIRNASDDVYTRENAVLTAKRSFTTALLALEEAVGGAVR